MELTVLKQAHFRQLAQEGKSKDTVKFYDLAYKEIESYLGESSEALQDVSLVTREDLYGVMGKLRDRGCQPGGVHAVMRGIRAIFNWAYEGDYIDRNPMDKVKMPSVPKKIQPAVQPELVQRV